MHQNMDPGMHLALCKQKFCPNLISSILQETQISLFGSTSFYSLTSLSTLWSSSSSLSTSSDSLSVQGRSSSSLEWWTSLTSLPSFHSSSPFCWKAWRTLRLWARQARLSDWSEWWEFSGEQSFHTKYEDQYLKPFLPVGININLAQWNDWMSGCSNLWDTLLVCNPCSILSSRPTRSWVFLLSL